MFKMGGRLCLLVCLSLCFAWTQPDLLQSRIIGGHEAKPHSRPYIAALKGDYGFFCGGTLIAPGWVVTAAHCLMETTVVLGAHDLHALEESQQVIGVKSYHAHPSYNKYTYANDILLLKLDFHAILNKYVQMLPLPESRGDLPDGTPCSLAGWGLIDRNKATERLFETDIAIYSRRKCTSVYPYLDDGMICAGSHNKMRDTSQGDSGGPMVCKGALHGVVSYGNNFPPGVYARVAYYLPWIKKVMELNP